MKPPEMNSSQANRTQPKYIITENSTLEDLINKYSNFDPSLVSDFYHGEGNKSAPTTDFLLKEFSFDNHSPIVANQFNSVGVADEEMEEVCADAGINQNQSTKSQSSSSPLTLSKNVSANPGTDSMIRP
jgi:hypothetical protein